MNHKALMNLKNGEVKHWECLDCGKVDTLKALFDDAPECNAHDPRSGSDHDFVSAVKGTGRWAK